MDMQMHRIGKIAVYLGIVLIVIGLFVGFSAIYMDSDGYAIKWLGVIPLGFVLLLLGTVMTQLSHPEKEREPPA